MPSFGAGQAFQDAPLNDVCTCSALASQPGVTGPFASLDLIHLQVAVFAFSGSYSVLASAVDSLVDLLSQAVLAVAEYQVCGQRGRSAWSCAPTVEGSSASAFPAVHGGREK